MAAFQRLSFVRGASLWRRCAAASTLLLLAGAVRAADTIPRTLSEVTLKAVANIDELTNQPDFWCMDVHFKPLRMVPVEVTDAATGAKSTKMIWYLCYRCVNREVSRGGQENEPANETDPPAMKKLFVPEFTLVCDDNGEQTTLRDMILPEALPVILKRERGNFRHSVDIVQEVPEPLPVDEVSGGLWGIAMFTGIPGKCDNYTMFMTGFSNGLKRTTSPSGETIMQAKTVQQKFWRPGDEFDRVEGDVRFDPKDPEPKWIYR